MPERRIPDDRRSNADRRQAKRVPLTREVRFLSTASPTTVLNGRLEDVSTSGVRLILDQFVPQGEKLLIEVRGATKTLCNVTVEVVWIEPVAPQRHRHGCESLTALSSRQMSQLKSAAVGRQSL